MGDAYQILEVIRQAIAQETQSGAMIEYSYGQIDTSSGYMVSAYLNGNYESSSEDFRLPGHLIANSGDYAMFAHDHARGSKWLVETLPSSLYSKIAIDINSGEILTGDGTVPPSIPISTSGQFAFYYGEGAPSVPIPPPNFGDIYVDYLANDFYIYVHNAFPDDDDWLYQFTLASTGGGGGSNIDGGDASETYGGTTAIDGGSA